MAQLAIILATVSYAGAAIFGRNFKDLDPMMPAAGSMVCGAAMLIPLSLFSRPARTLGSVGPTAQAYLRVPIGVAIGAYFLSESLGDTAWIGLICVVAGVAAMTVPKRKVQASAIPLPGTYGR